MTLIEFADFRLSLDTFSLHRGSESISIGKRSMDLLVHLIENRHRFVETEELREIVWSGEKLSPSAIATCVRELRRLLDDDAIHPRIVASKRGRGYRFVAHPKFAYKAPMGLEDSDRNLPFVGRTTELKALRDAHRAMTSRREGQLVVVRGEAGIGKTRLVDEFLKGVSSSVRKVVSRCSGEGQLYSYSAWDGLREAAGSLSSNCRGGYIGGLNLPAIQIEPAAGVGEVAAERSPRSAGFSKWTAAVRDFVGSTSTIFVFDDIHYGDPDSLHLVAWIAEVLRDLPVMLIVTQRPRGGSREISVGLEDIVAVEHCVVIDVEPISLDMIEEMVRPQFLHERIDASRLSLSTGGNPLLIAHAIRAACDVEGNVGSGFSAGRKVSRGGDVLARFTCDLPERTRGILAIAAMGGDEFSTSLVSRIAKIPLRDAEEALEPAVRSRLICESSLRLRFRHPVLREALVSSLDAATRKSMHKEVALFLQAEVGSPGEIARHMVLAMPHFDCAEVVRYCVLAFDDAVFRLDYSSARGFAETAVELLRNHGTGSTAERCRLMINFARCCEFLGERTTARSLLLEVAQMARSGQLPSLLSECAFALSDDFSSIDVGVHDIVLEMLIREALGVTPCAEMGVRARLLARLSLTMRWSEKYVEQASLAQESLALATESQDPDALREALSAIAESLHGPENAPRRLDAIERIAGIPSSCVDSGSALLQHTREITALLEMGRVDQVSNVNKAYRELAQRTGQEHHLWYALTTEAMRALMAGDMSFPVQLESSFQAICATGEIPNVVQGYAVQRFFREVECGHGKTVLPYLREIVAQYPLVTSWKAALAWLHWDLGDREEALRQVAPFNSRRVETLGRQVGSGAGLAMISEVLAHVGERPARKFLFEMLEPLKDRCAVAGYGVLYMGTFARHAGLLANSLGMQIKAVELLEMAVDQESFRGAELWRGYSLLELALALKSIRGGRNDARGVWSEADRVARSLRVPRLSKRVSEAGSILF